MSSSIFPFRIAYRLPQSTFIRLSFILRYRHWATLLLLFVGCILLVLGILQLQAGERSNDLFYGIAALLISPVMILVHTIKAYHNYPHLRQPINYEFTQEHLVLGWEGMESKVLWTHMLRMKIIAGFVMLYINDRSSAMIPVSSFTTDQLAAVREKMPQQ